LGTTSSSALANMQFKDNDGTFRIAHVQSALECKKLCASETLCRGTVTYQADVTKSGMLCRLNNGIGENSPFKVTPPPPVNLTVALSDLNRYRAQHNLSPVTLNDKLIKASKIHANDLAQSGDASHTGSDGSTHSDRVQRQGYYFSIAAENVATGQKSWKKVFEAWQKSPGHNANLLLPEATEFGAALTFEPTTTYATYWTMLMAAPLNESYH